MVMMARLVIEIAKSKMLNMLIVYKEKFDSGRLGLFIPRARAGDAFLMGSGHLKRS